MAIAIDKDRIENIPRIKFAENENGLPCLGDILSLFNPSDVIDMKNQTIAPMPSEKEKERRVQQLEFFFQDDPNRWFRGYVLILFEGGGGDELRELGALARNSRDARTYLQSFFTAIQSNNQYVMRVCNLQNTAPPQRSGINAQPS